MLKISPKRVAGALAVVVAASLVAIALVAIPSMIHRDRNAALRKTLDLVPGSLLHARNFHWTQMKGDHKQWELSAREASYSDDKTALKLREPDLLMVLDDGKTLILHAASAELKLNGKHIDEARLNGGLELKYGDIELSTAEATFVPDSDVLQASGPVEIRSPGFTVSGVGLEAHPRARRFSLQHQVRTELRKGATTGAGSTKS
jgi:LPS export ABC transporter protein LptC